jgi:hypothetical protein
MYLTFDNGGTSADRYTVFPFRRSRDCDVRAMYLGLSDNCDSPNGFSQWGETHAIGAHLGKRIPFASLPEHVLAHVLRRIEE